MHIVQEQGVELQCEVKYCRFYYWALDYFRIQILLFLSIYTPRLTVRMLIVQEQGVELQCEVKYCRFYY